MADAMLNPSYRESTLPPLPLPAALPSVGSFAHMTPAPLPPPPPAPAPPPPAQQPSPSSKSDAGSAAEVGAQGGNNNSGHGDPQRQLQDRPPSPLPIRPAPAAAQAPTAPPVVAPVAPCSGAGPLGPPPHGPAALMPSPPPPLPPPPAATPPQVAEVSPHLHPQPGPGQGGPQQGQGQGPQGQGQQEQISPHLHPQQGPTGSGPGDDGSGNVGGGAPQSHHHRHHHHQDHSPNMGPMHQQEHSPSLGPHHQPQPQQPQLQQPQPQPQQQHHRGHGHHHHHQHHRDATSSSTNATNKRDDDAQRGPNEGHSEKQGVAAAVADDAKPIEKTVVINLPPEAAERARDALDRHAAREEEVARIVRDLNLAVSPTDRNRALQSALSTFDHANAAMHDGEIDAGADCALTKHLALLLLKEQQSGHQGGGEGGGGRVQGEEGSGEDPSSPRLGPLDSSGSSSSSAQTEELCEEITNVTEALEMMYRCSAERVRESYGRVGSELLPMLMSLVERDLGKRRRALASCSASAAVAAAAAARAAASANEEVDEDELDEEEKKRKQRQQENPESHQEVESAEAESKQKEDGRPEKGPEDETDQDGGPPPEKKRKVSEDGSPVLAAVAFASSTKDAASAASASAPSSAAATIPHDCAATRQSSLGHACDYVSPTRNRRLRKITKVFGHFARVGALTQPLAYHSGLLSTLKHVIELPAGAGVGGVGSGLGGDGVGSGLAVPREARLNCLWILANLACNAENMVMMACQPGLLDLLVRTALSPAQTSEDDYGDIDRYMEAIRSRSIAVRALLNLSWAPENKLLLSEHSRLVGALTEALSYRASSWAGFGRGVSGILLQTRRLAAGALRNLAAAPIRNKIRLCRQPLLQPPHGHGSRGTTGSIGGGGGSQSLLDELTDAARHDPDAQVRDKAVATLHNLACADTAGGFARRPALLEVLSDAAMAYHSAYNNGGGGGAGGTRMPTTGRYTADAGNLANRTLRVLERSITEDMVEEYRAVRPLLDGVANAAAGRVSV